MFVFVCVVVKELILVVDGWIGIDWFDVLVLFKLVLRCFFKRFKVWVWVKVVVEVFDEELFLLEELEFEVVVVVVFWEVFDEDVDELVVVVELEDLLDEELELLEIVFICCFFVVEFFFEVVLLFVFMLFVVLFLFVDLLLL